MKSTSPIAIAALIIVWPTDTNASEGVAIDDAMVDTAALEALVTATPVAPPPPVVDAGSAGTTPTINPGPPTASVGTGPPHPGGAHANPVKPTTVPVGVPAGIWYEPVPRTVCSVTTLLVLKTQVPGSVFRTGAVTPLASGAHAVRERPRLVSGLKEKLVPALMLWAA